MSVFECAVARQRAPSHRPITKTSCCLVVSVEVYWWAYPPVHETFRAVVDAVSVCQRTKYDSTSAGFSTNWMSNASVVIPTSASALASVAGGKVSGAAVSVDPASLAEAAAVVGAARCQQKRRQQGG